MDATDKALKGHATLELSPHLGQVSLWGFSCFGLLIHVFVILSFCVNSMLVKLDSWSLNDLFIRPSLSPILWMKIQADPVISLIT